MHILKPNINWKIILLFLLFLASRIYIFDNHPDFSVVSNYYSPYARAWRAGFLPYLRQLYEYGPYTIPLFFLPYLLESITDFSYYQIYKFMLMVFDFVLFIFVLKYLINRSKIYIFPLLFYIVSGLFLKEFWYDSYDLVFAGVWFLSLYFLFQKNKKAKSWISQLFFWVTVGLKYINGPLIGIYYFVRNKKILWKNVAVSVAVFLLTWGVVIAKFKKSLLTTFALHGGRGLQVESLPANIVRFINAFTKSEGFEVISNAVEIVGPQTSRFLGIYSFLFPVLLGSFILFLYFEFFQKIKKPKDNHFIKATLCYIFAFMAFGKILSTPYLIWPVLFLAVLNTKNIGRLVFIYIWYLAVIFFSSLPMPNFAVGIFDFHTAIGLFRGLSLFVLALYFAITLNKNEG